MTGALSGPDRYSDGTVVPDWFRVGATVYVPATVIETANGDGDLGLDAYGHQLLVPAADALVCDDAEATS